MSQTSPETETDPTADARWNEGCDFAMTQLCRFLGVDPSDVNWDAATETVDGDVQAVIGNILCAKFGEDWEPSDGVAQTGQEQIAELAITRACNAKVDCLCRGEVMDLHKAQCKS